MKVESDHAAYSRPTPREFDARPGISKIRFRAAPARPERDAELPPSSKTSRSRGKRRAKSGERTMEQLPPTSPGASFLAQTPAWDLSRPNVLRFLRILEK